jgi:hypothetical protein
VVGGCLKSRKKESFVGLGMNPCPFSGRLHEMVLRFSEFKNLGVLAFF